MPKQIMPVGSMNLDKGPSPGDHLWVADNVIMQHGGYENLPGWSQLSTISVTASHMAQGAYGWSGGVDPRIYMATNDRFYEVVDSGTTNVTGTTTPTNSTNGVTFAGYGEWCFAANGVDPIQAIKVPSSTGSTLNFADMTYTPDGAKIAPKYICAHKNHIVAGNIKFVESWAPLAEHTTAVGDAFTQPAGSVIEVVSSAPAPDDTTQTITVYGTYTGGGDAVAIGTATLNGTTAVDISNPNGIGSTWQKILGWNKSAVTVGDITLRKDGGGTTIDIILAADVAAGISNVASDDQAGGGRVIDITCSTAASVRQVGIIGTDHTGATIYDSQALDGTATGVQSNFEFTTVTNVLIGDVAITDTITTTSNVYPRGYVDPYLVWWSGTDDPEGYGNEVVAPQIIGSSDQPLLDGSGKISGVADGGDCFFVFKTGSIHRFDGPPFQPTVISYSVGMVPGWPTWRQKDRLYFWSYSGLCYIDIGTNAVVNVMAGRMQRSVVDYANLNYGLSRGRWPSSRLSVSAGSIDHSYIGWDQSGRGTISGDPASNAVFMAFPQSSGTNCALLYNEEFDNFTVISTPNDYAGYGIVAAFMPTSSGSIPGMLSNLRLFTSFTTIVYSKLIPTAFSSTNNNDCYLRWPFFASGTDRPRTRILSVRPVFNDAYVWTADVVYAIQVDVLSVNGVGKAWTDDGVVSKGRTAYVSSLDGWLHIDGCPFADKHSIGVSIKTALTSPGGFPHGMQEFTHIEVEYVEEARKGI